MVAYDSPLSHRRDPETSAEAAQALANDGRLDTHEWRILCVLRDAPYGLTGRQIAARIQQRFHVPMTQVQVMRRMRALLDRGQVFRRRDPRDPTRWQRRDGQALHFATPGDMPLFGL